MPSTKFAAPAVALSSIPQLGATAKAGLWGCLGWLLAVVRPPFAAVSSAFAGVPRLTLFVAGLLMIVTLALNVKVWVDQSRRVATPQLEERVRLAGRAAYGDYPSLAFPRKPVADYLRAGTGAEHFLASRNPRPAALPANFDSAYAVLGNLHVLGAARAYAFPFDAAGAPADPRQCLVSPDALQFAVLAGARAVDLDVWPDPEGSGRPIVAVMDPASSWRRLSLNALPLRALLDALADAAFRGGDATNPLRTDPLLLYLRFHGAPTPYTYERTAEALTAALGAHRLSAAAYGAKGGGDTGKLARMPVAAARGKVVLLARTPERFPPPPRSAMAEWINAEVREVTPGAAALADATTADRDKSARAATENVERFAFGWCDEPEAATAAHSVGVHVAAMNPWVRGGALDAYRGFFGPHSFRFKARTGSVDPLLYVPPIQRVQDPSPTLNANEGQPAPVPGLSTGGLL